MTLSRAPWWCAPVLALAWMWTVPAQIFCAPTRAKLIAAARFMPGVCGVLVSSWSPGMTLTPCVFQSIAACRSLISPIPATLLASPEYRGGARIINESLRPIVPLLPIYNVYCAAAQRLANANVSGKLGGAMPINARHATGEARMIGRFAVAAAFTALLIVPALAQTTPAAPPVRIRGTVDKLDADKLTIKARDGMDMTVALTDKTRINTLVKKSLTDIKAGDFLASTGVKGTDGKLHAIEVRILPQPTPDGGRQFPWDLGSDS